jgi:hypothetical protein
VCVGGDHITGREKVGGGGVQAGDALGLQVIILQSKHSRCVC